MLKIIKSDMISFMWEKDKEPGVFENLKDNKDFHDCVSELVAKNIPIKIEHDSIKIKATDIQFNRSLFIENLLKLEILFNDFFNTELYFKYKIISDFNLSEYRLSIDTVWYQIHDMQVFLYNNNLYTLVDDSYYLSRIESSLDPECNSRYIKRLVIGQKHIDIKDKSKLIPIIQKKEFDSVEDLLKHL